MKNAVKTISISIEKDLLEKIKSKKNVSRFVSFAIKAQIKKEEDELAAAYESAEKDVERRALIEEWDAI